MNLKQRLTTLSALTLALVGPSSLAINFSVNPVVLQIDPNERMVSQTRLANQDSVPVSFTVEVMKWTQEGGKDIYTPTRDVLVNPAQFTVQPGNSQIIRVGLRKKPDQPELTYRIFIKQLPPEQQAVQPTQNTTAQINTLLNIGVPFYVTEPSAQARLGLKAVQQEGQLVVLAHNSGTRREVLQNPRITVLGKTTPLGSRAALSGSELRFAVPTGEKVDALVFAYTDAAGKEHSETLSVQHP